MEDHDWHVFDVEKGWEVARRGDKWLARRIGTEPVIELTPDEFDQWRREGPNPEGVD